MKKEESPSIDSAINPMNNNKRNFSSSSSSSSSTLSTMPTTAPSSESSQLGKLETNATAPITSSIQTANNSATVESIMTANTKNKHISLSSDDLRIKEEEAKEALNLLPSSVNPRMTYDRERLLIDRGGHTHYIGSHGTASLLNGLCDIIIKRSYNQKKPPTSTQDLRDISVQTISSENEPVYQYPTHLYNLDLININKFPLINLLKRDEADSYTNVFFEKVHPYYFIFNQETFREKYELFWKEISESKKSSESGHDNNNNNNANHARHDSTADGLTPLKLSPAEICSIYMVWILGRRFQQFSNPHELPRNSELNNELTARYIDIIKLSLSDIVLTPTIDGIRLIFLLSVYLSSIKVRESGWILMELACRQSMSLGLHRSLIINKFGSEKSQEMKRMIWSLIKAESTLCSSLGRPSALPLDEIDAELPSNDDVKDELFKVFYNQTSFIFG
ncbi:unnamed protein product [[Candida] boidinii]|nr:unnamed protein product [[Candida] boidinii]